MSLATPASSSPELDEVTRCLRRAGVPTRFEGARFSNFETRPGTNIAFKTSEAVVTEQTSLLLSGPPGTGKTHLAVSMLAALIAGWLTQWPAPVQLVDEAPGLLAMGRPRLVVHFVVIPSFLDAIRATIRHAERMDPLQQLIEADLVVLDDLGRERSTDWATERLYVLINERYNRCLPTVATTNFTPQELANRGYDVHVSRLAEDARFIRVEATDYRRRRQ